MDESRRRRTLSRYRLFARFYDSFGRSSVNRRLREEAVRRLELAPGQVALDVGCGTGLSFELIEERIGPQGRLIGVELSPDMLARARQKVAARGWQNVTLIEAAAEEAHIPEEADAALFFFTHDIMQSELALTNVLAHLKPGGRVVASGGKRPSGLLGPPLTLALLPFYAPFITTTEGAARPWAKLERFLPGLKAEERLFGAVYIARGSKADAGRESTPGP